MEYTYRKKRNLFLQQSYLDSWTDYERSLMKDSFIKWDYVILTASNEEQAAIYEEQIEYRLKNHLIPSSTIYRVIPDPEGKRVGSGGATLNVLRYLAEQNEGKDENPFEGKRVLVIHSGGDSKRVPQYSAIGKLFSPVPRELPDGRASTLFDEFMIGMSAVPSRIKDGMLVLSGDVLLLFNPLQIDALFNGAAAISIKEPVTTGKNHGVFLSDEQDQVRMFLHKQTEEHLCEMGAVNENGYVDLDTGAILMDINLLQSLYSLISTDGKIDEEKFAEFVNEDARISFYGDFLYPLAKEATLEAYYKEAAEGTINEKLLSCRRKIWDAISEYSMKVLCLSPAAFIHFGTTRELMKLLGGEIDDYEFLGWKHQVASNGCQHKEFSANIAYIGHDAIVEENAYIENSYILGKSKVGEGAIVSNLKLRSVEVPAHTVWHGLTLKDKSRIIRVYGVEDNPKGMHGNHPTFLGTTLEAFMEKNDLQKDDLWSDDETYLWFAKLYPACVTREEAVRMAGILSRMAEGTATKQEVLKWKHMRRESLYSSFNQADVLCDCDFGRDLESRILASKFIKKLEDGVYYKEAFEVFGRKGMTEAVYQNLMNDAEEADSRMRIRIYYAISRWIKQSHQKLGGQSYDVLEAKSLNEIQEMIYRDALMHLPDNSELTIQKEEVDVQLPVRVNWGGGWTDTPPHCNECGGTVLNAAIKLNGIYPVQVSIHRLETLHIEFESQDIGVKGTVETVEEILDCENPYDSFALHKAALIACGIIPRDGEESLQEILQRMGGGIYLSTQVVRVPKGSGLGTSSILSAACAKAIFEFFGKEMSNERVSDIVLCMEQFMSTGGGWQDQVGGLTEGVKFIRSMPGIHQNLSVEYVEIPESAKQELQERFALIYTGQRRLARNLLRDIVGSYVGCRPDTIEALKRMPRVAAMMKFELERGNIDAFAELMNVHWNLSKQLDSESTNTCIDMMFEACEDLICGKFISGAGGGGFLQVILKKGVTKEQLKQRMHGVFQDSGVDVWDCEILF